MRFQFKETSSFRVMRSVKFMGIRSHVNNNNNKTDDGLKFKDGQVQRNKCATVFVQSRKYGEKSKARCHI